MKFATILVWAGLLASLVSCGPKPLSKGELMQKAEANSAKRYHLKGKVVSIDKQGKMANIDSEAIPGFMDKMTMPYTIKTESELEQLKPGDAITADVVVQDESAWLEKVVVTSQADAKQK